MVWSPKWLASMLSLEIKWQQLLSPKSPPLPRLKITISPSGEARRWIPQRISCDAARSLLRRPRCALRFTTFKLTVSKIRGIQVFLWQFALNFTVIEFPERPFPPFVVRIVDPTTGCIVQEANEWKLCISLFDGYGRQCDEMLADSRVISGFLVSKLFSAFLKFGSSNSRGSL